MGFYDEISKYYDYIFPVSRETVDFIRRAAGNPPKTILDVACGTGGYSMELEQYGYDLAAVDLDSAMIESLKRKADRAKSKVRFLQADMLDLEDKFPENQFDVVFCVGNSLVHLDSSSQIRDFFNHAGAILTKDGTLIVQIINFDRILSKNVTSLPTVYNEAVGLTFERFYRYDPILHKVFFKTILTVEGRKIENEIGLTPILFDEMIEFLEGTGFHDIQAYGDFNDKKFDKDNSFMLIIKTKQRPAR